MISILAFTFVIPVFSMRDQSVAIKGSLRCHLTPLSNVVVELHERRKGVFTNQVLDTNHTDAQGKFYLSGGTNRLLPMMPLLYIPQDCKRKEVSIKLNIAKSSVTSGKVPKTVVDVGIINLEVLKAPPTTSSSPQADSSTYDIPYIDAEYK